MSSRSENVLPTAAVPFGSYVLPTAPVPSSLAQGRALTANVREHDEYIRWRLAEHDKQKPSSPAEVRLKKALDALSPRSIRAWRLGPPFDPFLGTCPYPFPEVSGGPSIPPPSAARGAVVSAISGYAAVRLSIHIAVTPPITCCPYRSHGFASLPSPKLRELFVQPRHLYGVRWICRA